MRKNNARRILVVIGAYPDIGKGILTASCAYLLQREGLNVLPLKFDGYMNFNSGTMNPYHKSMDVLYAEEEVFVLKDGFEADADSGYYERFLGVELSADHNMTNGQLFAGLLAAERDGKLSPGEILKFTHLRNHLIEWLINQSSRADVIVLEVGGTVGDAESASLYDAIRIVKHRRDVNLGILLLAPHFAPTHDALLAKSNRTKLARQMFERVTLLGLRPDVLMLRCQDRAQVSAADQDYILSDCGIGADDLFFDPDCAPVYALPRCLAKQGLSQRLGALLDFEPDAFAPRADERLENYCARSISLRDKGPICIGVFGKAVSHDSFVSLREAIEHAAVSESCHVEITWIDDLIKDYSDVSDLLRKFDGLIVAEGLQYWKEKIAALQVARTATLPTLCLSFGFDLAAIELATNMCGCAEAFLEELESGKGSVKVAVTNPVKGDYAITLTDDSGVAKLYGNRRIVERHRHQSWLSRDLIDLLIAADVLDSGYADDGNLEIFELRGHPFYFAMKAHPEFKSWPGNPSPPFVGLIQSAQEFCAKRAE